ncbi:MAG: hypothetical protein QXU32_01510 [Nitrososphaerales archaeon]
MSRSADMIDMECCKECNCSAIDPRELTELYEDSARWWEVVSAIGEYWSNHPDKSIAELIRDLIDAASRSEDAIISDARNTKSSDNFTFAMSITNDKK